MQKVTSHAWIVDAELHYLLCHLIANATTCGKERDNTSSKTPKVPCVCCQSLPQVRGSMYFYSPSFSASALSHMHSHPSPSPADVARVHSHLVLLVARCRVRNHAHEVHDDDASSDGPGHRHSAAFHPSPSPSQMRAQSQTRMKTRRTAVVYGICNKLSCARRRSSGTISMRMCVCMCINAIRTLGFLLPASLIVDDVRVPSNTLARTPLGTAELKYAHRAVGFFTGRSSTATCGIVVFWVWLGISKCDSAGPVGGCRRVSPLRRSIHRKTWMRTRVTVMTIHFQQFADIAVVAFSPLVSKIAGTFMNVQESISFIASY